MKLTRSWLENYIDIHHAGTAMRFLTALLSIQNNKEFVVTGSKRMKQRPIEILVDALNNLGADISYNNKTGFIESLSYTMPDTGNWETETDGSLLPKFIDVSLTIKFVEVPGSELALYSYTQTPRLGH